MFREVWDDRERSADWDFSRSTIDLVTDCLVLTNPPSHLIPLNHLPHHHHHQPHPQTLISNLWLWIVFFDWPDETLISLHRHRRISGLGHLHRWYIQPIQTHHTLFTDLFLLRIRYHWYALWTSWLYTPTWILGSTVSHPSLLSLISLICILTHPLSHSLCFDSSV